MLDKNILESFESIKSKYSLDEADLDNATRMERNQIEELKITIKNKKDELLKRAAQNALKEQEEFFKYKVIPTEEAALKFIEQYARSFFTEYKLGRAELKDSILYSYKSARVFESLVEVYPFDIRWVLEYISGIKNGLVASAPGTFIRERLQLLLSELQVNEVLVECSWSYQYNEWSEPDYGSSWEGGWCVATGYQVQILLLKQHEFETLSKFTSKKYKLLSDLQTENN